MPFPPGFGKSPATALSVTSEAKPKPKPNPNLTAALRASLESIDNPLKDQSPEGFTGSDSPLESVEPDSVDILLERVNEHLAAGMPERITDDLLRRLVDNFRAEALYWEQLDSQPKERQKRGQQKPVEKLLLEF